MTFRQYLFLALLGLTVAILVTVFQAIPEYLDASYYCATGLRLANGHGFTEPFLWNYLDDPAGLPHPSHAYWMPLPSLLAAAGAVLFGTKSCASARIVFVLLAGLLPPLTAALAWSLSPRRDHALLAGLLAAFPAFYAPYLPATDTFGPYLLLGGLFFLVCRSLSGWQRDLLLGGLAGLMHLTRVDGLLWLLIGWLAAFLLRKGWAARVRGMSVVLVGYLTVMTPWLVRNWMVFGAPLGAAGSRVLWLTSYNQIFSYPADHLTFQSWWDSGFGNILRARWWALRLNLQSAVGVQGTIFLTPCLLAGIWVYRRDIHVRLALVAWFLLFVVMTVVFPFAGARGSFFHAGAAFQVLWWALIPGGLEQCISWLGRWRRWQRLNEAQSVFRVGAAGLAILLTLALLGQRALGRLQASDPESNALARYAQVNHFLETIGAQPDDVVVVADPPSFYLVTGHPAIVLPDGDVTTLQALARRYQARYLVLEANAITDGLQPLYEQPTAFPAVMYLGEVEGARVFSIQP